MKNARFSRERGYGGVASLAAGEDGEGKSRNRRRCRPVRRQQRVLQADDTDGDDSVCAQIERRKTMKECLEQLGDKIKSKREEAIWEIVGALTYRMEREFVENNFATLLYHCLCCLKKGTAKSVELASRAVGLLAMSVEDAEDAHEAYTESLPVFIRALKSSATIGSCLAIIDSLAITTFFGAINSLETEEAMEITWELFNPNKECSSCTKAVACKPSGVVIAAAISAWSFLLSTMESWNLNQKLWSGAVSCFSNLLDQDSDEIVSRAAAEALALILEINCLDKLSSREKDPANSFSCGETPASSKEQELKGEVIARLKRHAAKGEAYFNGVVESLEGGEALELHTMICKNELVLSSWSQLIQLYFMERWFMGDDGGFIKHVTENENLHRIFEYTPRGKGMTANQLGTPDREDVTVCFFQPQLGSLMHQDSSLLAYVNSNQKSQQKRMTQSPSTLLSKFRTQLLKKKRMVKNASYLR